MLDHPLRHWKERVLAPLARGPLGRVHPNFLSSVSAALGLTCALFAALGCMRLALFFWLANRCFDGLDGTVARLHQKTSDWGAYLDILYDHVIYAAIPLALAVSSADPKVYLACAFLQAAFFVNTISWCYLSALLEKRQAGAAERGELTSVTMPAALIEGAETVLFFSCFLIWPGAALWLFSLMALLVSLGVFQRWQFARKELSS